MIVDDLALRLYVFFFVWLLLKTITPKKNVISLLKISHQISVGLIFPRVKILPESFFSFSPLWTILIGNYAR